MPQAELKPSRNPRYFRATVVTALTMLVVPALLLLLFLWSVSGSAVKASEAQGVAVIGVAIAFAITFACIAFPVTAKYLHSRSQFHRSKFYSVVFISLAITSLLFCLAWALSEGDWYMAFMTPALFVVGGVIVLPFRALWFKLANAA